MKTVTKLMLAGAALAAGGVANAQISTLPSASGGSDLVLFVVDTTTNTSFVQDLGDNVYSLGPTATSIASDPAYGHGTYGALSNPLAQSSVIGAGGVDSALATYLGTTGSSDTIYYTILGASTGDGSANPGQAQAVATLSNTAAGNFASSVINPTGKVGTTNFSNSFNNTAGNIATFFAAVNSSTATFGQAPNDGLAVTTVAEADRTLIGNAANLFEFANSSNTYANVYEASTQISISRTGVVSGFVTAAPVPLPAAVWLFGSGLLGMFGIGRRRPA